MTRALTALNATVTTATVTIKTLTIDRRQVTLSTFRQVPEADIFDNDANLRGIPWGRVNYCPGKTCGEGTLHDYDAHDHLLWQQGDTLHRCRLADRLASWQGWRPRWLPDGRSYLADVLRRIGEVELIAEAHAHAVTRVWPRLRRQLDEDGRYSDPFIDVPVISAQLTLGWADERPLLYLDVVDGTATVSKHSASQHSYPEGPWEWQVPTVYIDSPAHSPERLARFEAAMRADAAVGRVGVEVAEARIAERTAQVRTDEFPAPEPIDLRTMSEAEMLAPIVEHVRRWREIAARWEAHAAVLSDLDQLYIAT